MKQVTLVIQSPVGNFYTTIWVNGSLSAHSVYTQEIPALLRKINSMLADDETGEPFFLPKSLLEQSAFAIRGL